MSRKEHHVVTNPNGGWDVKRENAQRASGHFDTKKEAVEYATKVSQNQRTELVIHNKDNKIANSNSFGNDPYPPKDKK